MSKALTDRSNRPLFFSSLDDFCFISGGKRIYTCTQQQRTEKTVLQARKKQHQQLQLQQQQQQQRQRQQQQQQQLQNAWTSSRAHSCFQAGKKGSSVLLLLASRCHTYGSDRVRNDRYIEKSSVSRTGTSRLIHLLFLVGVFRSLTP